MKVMIDVSIEIARETYDALERERISLNKRAVTQGEPLIIEQILEKVIALGAAQWLASSSQHVLDKS